MDKELKALIDSDINRIYDVPLTSKQKLVLNKSLEYKYLRLWRKASYYKQNKPNSLLTKFYTYKLFELKNKTQISIPPETKIGPGLYIGHLGRIIINENAVIGKNVNLSTGITIGQTNRGSQKGSPIIGDNVWIGTNAVIVGKIKIGDDVLIAPNAYVNMDVPSHSIVIGNPAVIHPSENATKDYINRTC